jgi:hypothetical protein
MYAITLIVTVLECSFVKHSQGILGVKECNALALKSCLLCESRKAKAS